MDDRILMWIWLVVGVLALASELIIPGMVTGFLGAAAIIVAALLGLGVIGGINMSLVAWMLSSVLLIVTLRRALLKRFPAHVTREPPLDDVQLHGTIVDVVDAISEDNQNGRIRLHGTSWPAQSQLGRIPAGSKARLVFRDNLAWHVEPMPELEASQSSDDKN